MTSDLVAVAS